MTDQQIANTASIGSETELTVIGTAGSHDALCAALAARPAAKVLDIPAGEGPISRFLHERGWDVSAADIDQGNFRYENVPFREVNLNRPLPYDDVSFDAVVCANALQRLFNVGGAVGEFHRIIRPGGHLYINVNNYASIDRRLRFLFCGSMDTGVNEGQCRQTIDDPEAHVRQYLLFTQIANMLDAAGFGIVDMRPSAVLLHHRLLTPVAWLSRLVSLLVPPARRRRDHIAAANSSAIIPGGQYMFIDAVKADR